MQAKQDIRYGAFFGASWFQPKKAARAGMTLAADLAPQAMPVSVTAALKAIGY